MRPRYANAADLRGPTTVVDLERELVNVERTALDDTLSGWAVPGEKAATGRPRAAVSSGDATAWGGDRREYLPVRFTAQDELRPGGHLVIAGDAHDQHNGTARQAASLDRCSRYVIGGLESRHAILGLQRHRPRLREKRASNMTSRLVFAMRSLRGREKGLPSATTAG